MRIVGMFGIGMNITARKNGGAHGRLLAGPQAAQMREAQQRAELGPALAAGEFIPYYQPIFSLVSGEIVGMEVLARWQHPRRGLLAPGDFIPTMEQQRLCADLITSLLHQVIAHARSWPRAWTFALNASASQMRETLAFISVIDRVPDRLIDPRRIELEVTETVLIDDMGLARRMVQSTHRAGGRVALDDFGTGYSNFLSLRELPFDRIKIDRCFVRDMLSSARSLACIRAMLAAAHSLGASVVAEGVESEAVACTLRDMGCEFAQGYYYSPPVPSELVARLAGQADSPGNARAERDLPHPLQARLVRTGAVPEAGSGRTPQE